MADSSSICPSMAEAATVVEEITSMDSELYWAAAKGDIDIFKEDTELQLDQILTPGKNSVLHVHITASLTGETDFVNEILGTCQQLLKQSNGDGDIPLHMAARYGHENIVNLLIDRNKALDHDHCDLESGTVVGGVAAKEMLRKKNKENNTSLHEAVRFRHLGVVRILTREDPDYLYDANESGETPLYMAAERGYGDVVCEILSNCSSVAAGGPNRRTALHAAVIAKEKEITKKILKEKVHLTKEADDKGWVPLHYAVDLNHLSIVQILLHCDKKVAYSRDKEGRTPLHIAASKGNYKILRRIILLCPDCCEVMDNKGWNVLHHLVQRRAKWLLSMKLILKNPAYSYLLNVKDNEGNTPFHFLMSTDMAKRLLAHPRLDKMVFNKQNQNALDMASTSNGRVFGKVKGNESMTSSELESFGGGVYICSCLTTTVEVISEELGLNHLLPLRPACVSF
ncbi:uncharacterized protein LOC133830008 isoform X2 [Humulus lupulus]|uniref:uncharacterized protein LOC133830008 isoform X2 n=1 Tax=Humulus lupulus TaxID=3486 RepID=UPI002B40574B|nr:uncharacterized protein LOC133830008 isoform X2 [Humulus lupulus]